MIGCSKKNSQDKIVQENAFDEKKKRPGLKFNPRLALIMAFKQLAPELYRCHDVVIYKEAFWCLTFIDIHPYHSIILYVACASLSDSIVGTY